MKNYEVQAGDTLSAIAAREYGDGSLYPVISRQNHLANANLIDVGQELLIPYVTYRHLFTTADSTAARTQLTEHYYGASGIQLIWEIVNGVAQREIQRGAWLHIPDLANVGHHTVVADETPIGLAAGWYGDEHLAAVIELANGLPAGSALTPGQVLIVPRLNRRGQVSGDTLASLCRDEYGDTDVDTRVSVLAAANHIDDPDLVFSNQVVYFPS
jgi:nucleoid-associated protein YgaU